LKTLKNKLSKYVRLAAGGETVLITDRERVVAELGPPKERLAATPPDAVLAEAVCRGHLTPRCCRQGRRPSLTPSRH
jgi:antitoxin (DNA-binding transcriptional repressor) of toxin-antitoxin stability system